MSLINKLQGMKETIVENFEEYAIIKDMSAQEIAERYGYEKLLSYIRVNLIMSAKRDNEDCIETDDVLETPTPSILIKISKSEDNSFTVDEDGFGAKEAYDLNIIRFMIKKYGASTSVGSLEGMDGEYLKIEMIPQKTTIEKRLENLYENKDEYFELAKGKADMVKKAAGNATKKLLNNLADWANNNL